MLGGGHGFGSSGLKHHGHHSSRPFVAMSILQTGQKRVVYQHPPVGDWAGVPSALLTWLYTCLRFGGLRVLAIMHALNMYCPRRFGGD